MNEKRSNSNNLKKTCSAFDINEKKLNSFYLKNFSDRSCRLEDLWQWLYRTDFFSPKKHPILHVEEDEVVGHMGLIPFWLNVENKKILASWYTDMYVVSQFRGKGIANNITEELMKLTDIHFGFVGNDGSMGVFKKYGWVDSYEGYLHHFFLQPMNHPKFIKYSNYFKWIYLFINFIFKNFFSKYYLFKRNKSGILTIENLNKDNIKTFVDIKNENNVIKPIRDEEYLHWRFLNSPEIKKYKIFKDENGLSALIKERKDKPNSWHLDILLISDFSNEKNLISLLANIILWAKNHKYSYVKIYISDKNLSKKISWNLLSFVKNPRFFYYSSDKNFLNILKKGAFFWQLADSDFEIIL